MMMMMMMMMRTRSIAAEFALSRSLISSVQPPVRMTRGGAYVSDLTRGRILMMHSRV